MSDSDDLLFDSDSDSDLELELDIVSDSDPIESLPHYTCLTLSNLVQRLDQLASQAASLTTFAPGQCLILLNSYDWDLAKFSNAYLESPDAVAGKLGLESVNNAATHTLQYGEAGRKKWLCPVCADDSPMNECVSIGCGHFVCKECFNSQIRYRLLEEGNLFTTKCPGDSDCKYLITREMIPTEMQSLFNKQLATSFAAQHSDKYRHCPHAGCNHFAYLQELKDSENNRCEPIECICGGSFCFNCGLPVDHLGLPCELAKKWLEISGVEELNHAWISEHSKKCPKCHASTERIEGCNHIVCALCRFEYCWVCLNEWAKHFTRSYYNCVPLFNKPIVPRKLSSDKKRMQKETEKYVFYGGRFVDHRIQALKANNKTFKRAHTLMSWSFALLYFLQTSNLKSILENLVIGLDSDLVDETFLVEHKTETLYKFIMETDWLVKTELLYR